MKGYWTLNSPCTLKQMYLLTVIYISGLRRTLLWSVQQDTLTFIWAVFAYWKGVKLQDDSQRPAEIVCDSAQLLCLSL